LSYNILLLILVNETNLEDLQSSSLAARAESQGRDKVEVDAKRSAFTQPSS